MNNESLTRIANGGTPKIRVADLTSPRADVGTEPPVKQQKPQSSRVVRWAAAASVAAASVVAAPLYYFTAGDDGAAQAIQAAQTDSLKTLTSLKNREPALVSAYFNKTGGRVAGDGDFAVQASLYPNNAVALLLAQGPYAGTRVTIRPDQAAVLVERVAKPVEVKIFNRTLTVLQPLTAQEKTETVLDARAFDATGYVPSSLAGKFVAIEQRKMPDGKVFDALKITGDPLALSFRVQAVTPANVYEIDLKSGQFALKGIYLPQGHELRGRFPAWQGDATPAINPVPSPKRLAGPI